MAVTVCKILMEHVQDTTSIEAAMEKEQFGADELMAVTITYDFDARVRSYELLAEMYR